MNYPVLGDGLTLLLKEIPLWEMREQRSQRARQAVLELLQSHLPQINKVSHYPNGKPYLADCPSLSLSISHSDRYAAVLLSEEKPLLGLDIEDWGEQVERVRHKFLDEVENRLVAEAADERLALHLAWSAKESLYKALNPKEPYLEAFKIIDLHLDKAKQTGELRIAYKSNQFILQTFYCSDYVLTLIAE